jgi:predicted Zn-dependent protease
LNTGRGREAEVPLRRIGDETAAPGLQLTLADYYVGQNRKDDARTILQRLLEHPESAAAASARLAAIEYESGRQDAARKLIDDLLAKQPNAQLNVLKGQWLLAERKPRQALDAAAAAIKLDPRSSAAWVLKGSTQLALNDPGEAEKAFAEALRVNPSPLTLSGRSPISEWLEASLNRRFQWRVRLSLYHQPA